MKENEKPQAFSHCGARAKNRSVLKSPPQPRWFREWPKLSRVWSRNHGPR